MKKLTTVSSFSLILHQAEKNALQTRGWEWLPETMISKKSAVWRAVHPRFSYLSHCWQVSDRPPPWGPGANTATGEWGSQGHPQLKGSQLMETLEGPWSFFFLLLLLFFLTVPHSLWDLSFPTGIEPRPLAVRARSLNYWTTRKFSYFFFFFF